MTSPAEICKNTEGSAQAGTPFDAYQKGPAPTTLVLAPGGFVGDSIVDGPGLRCTLFVQGCPHGCPGCHNPATHPFLGGQEAGLKELVRRIKARPLCRGVTFSGGEPFAQAAALAKLGAMLKAEGYELAAYTGYTLEALLQNQNKGVMALLRQLDILVDGPFIERRRQLTLRFRGSANQRILNLPLSLKNNAPVPETAPRWTGEEPPVSR